MCFALTSAGGAAEPLPDISGMALFDVPSEGGARYVAVLDRKGFQRGERIGVLVVAKDGGVAFHPVAVTGWLDAGGPASDLEGVSLVPGAKGWQFVLLESSYWTGKDGKECEQNGRLFHLRLRDVAGQWVGDIERVVHLPKSPQHFTCANGGKFYKYNFEGVACLNWSRRKGG
jgi:hypothetical protein